jgi:hypothetical protein
MFQQLTKDDLNASTAILNPNVAGSTSVHLSWIWQNSFRTGVIANSGVSANAKCRAMAMPDAAAEVGRFWECKVFWVVMCIHCAHIFHSQMHTLASFPGSEKLVEGGVSTHHI